MPSRRKSQPVSCRREKGTQRALSVSAGLVLLLLLVPPATGGTQTANPETRAAGDAESPAPSPQSKSKSGTGKQGAKDAGQLVEAATRLNGPVILSKTTLLPAPLTYSLWNGIPVLDQIINDRALERFVLDTGLNANTISPAAAARLQLTPTGEKLRVALLDGTQESGVVTFDTLKIGLVAVEKASAALLDVTGSLSHSPHADGPTGWLGTPYLSAFQVTFDPVGNTLILDSPLASLPRGKDVVTVPLILRDGRPYVNVSVGAGKPFLALVNTGSPGTLVPASVLGRIKPDRTAPLTLPDGKTGTANIVTLPILRVGKAEWKQARALALAGDAPGVEPGFAVLGMDFLSRFKVTLNYAQQKMTLTPPITPTSVAPKEPGKSPKKGK